MAVLHLRPAQRLKTSAQFQQVFSARQVRHGPVSIYRRANGMSFCRIGVSVGRKHGNAPARNLFKRICREAFRLTQAHWPTGMDLVFVPRKAPRKDPCKENAALSTAQLAQELVAWASGLEQKKQLKSAGGRHQAVPS